MPVTASLGVVTMLFDCAQWDAMDSGKSGYTLVKRDCDGELPISRRPFAEPRRILPRTLGAPGSNIQFENDPPIYVTVQNGVVTISLLRADLVAGSSKVSVVDGTQVLAGGVDASVDIVEANILLQNLGGLLGVAQINTAGSTAGQVVTNVGGVGTWATPAPGYTNEEAQDAVGAMVDDTDTVQLVYTDATPALTANARLQLSITSDAAGIKLVNDASTPGNSFYYGTSAGGVKGYHALPAGASKWTDGTGGSIYRNSNVAIGNAPTPTARFTVDGGGAFYPILAYTNNNVSAWNIFANTDTAKPVGLALSELITGADLAFIINRYGSTHATTPNKVEMINQKNAGLVLGTNGAERIQIAAGGAVTVPNVGGTGTRLLQADSAGTLARSTLDPAALVAYTFANGLTLATSTVKWGGTLTEATTITQGANAIRFTGNYTSLHKTTNNPTPRATLTVDGLAVVPSTSASPSEDAVVNIHGTTAGPTQIDAQLSVGANPTATDGVWVQGRSITSYTTTRPIKMQPRGGKMVFGANTNFDPQFTMAGSGLGTTIGTLLGVTLHVCNTGENNTRPKISLGTGPTFLAGWSHDSVNVATRVFNMSTSATASLRFGLGGEDSDKVVIMPGGAGRLGAGFASTTGLHSTMQSSGSLAAAILGSPVSAPTVDEAKHTMLWESNSNVTYTLPTASTCVGRIYILANFGTGTLTLAVTGGGSISRGGGTFNTLAQGQWCWVQARSAGWVGYKVASL